MVDLVTWCPFNDLAAVERVLAEPGPARSRG